MRNLSLQDGIGTDPAYLNGNLVDTQTIIGEGINQDLVQFFQKLASLASITPNNLPDNETNGYQLITALESVVRSYAASTTQKGTSEFATNTETQTGTDATRTITPAGLSSRTATEARTGILELATQVETDAGSDDARAITPLKLRTTVFTSGQIPNLDAAKITTGTFAAARIPQATETAVGGAEIATTAEAQALTDDTKMITPAKLADVVGTAKRKVIEIGDWNMDSTASVNVTHGLSYDDIIGVQVLIRSDSGAAVPQKRPLDYSITGAVNNGFYSLISGNTFITLFRDAGGVFDNTDHDSTSYNRGWIIIDYV